MAGQKQARRIADVGRRGSAAEAQSGKAWFGAASLGDPHPCSEPNGWPEFKITLTYYVSSDDPAVIDAKRHEMFDRVGNLLADELPHV